MARGYREQPAAVSLHGYRVDVDAERPNVRKRIPDNSGKRGSDAKTGAPHALYCAAVPFARVPHHGQGPVIVRQVPGTALPCLEQRHATAAALTRPTDGKASSAARLQHAHGGIVSTESVKSCVIH